MWINDKRCENGCNETNTECKALECAAGELRCLTEYYLGRCKSDRSGWERTYCVNGCRFAACAQGNQVEVPEGMIRVPVAESPAGGVYGYVPASEQPIEYYHALLGTGPQAGTQMSRATAAIEREQAIQAASQAWQRMSPTERNYAALDAALSPGFLYGASTFVGYISSDVGGTLTQGTLSSYRIQTATRYSAGVPLSDIIPQKGYVGGTQQEAVSSYFAWQRGHYEELIIRRYESFKEAAVNASREQLLGTQEIIRAKYGLPPREMRFDNPYEYQRMLDEIARQEGIEVRERYEFQRFFEEVPQAEAVHMTGRRVVVEGSPETVQSSAYEHELIHALQEVRYPSMSIVDREFEAYMAGFSSKVFEYPGIVEDVFSFFIHGSLNVDMRLAGIEYLKTEAMRVVQSGY